MPELDRRLVAVMFTDMVGYTALIQADEIVAVEGVDMVLMGLNDLLADWGIPGQYDDSRRGIFGSGKISSGFAKRLRIKQRAGAVCGQPAEFERRTEAAESSWWRVSRY